MRLLRQGLNLLLAGLTFCSTFTTCQLSATPQPIFGRLTGAIAKLSTIRAAQLPPEAKKTLTLIDRGGPFPYPQDGTVFGNFEGRLPKKPKGYYREYTIPTPGASNRGARRFVVGQNQEIYYTNNHYNSFFQVIR